MTSTVPAMFSARRNHRMYVHSAVIGSNFSSDGFIRRRDGADLLPVANRHRGSLIVTSAPIVENGAFSAQMLPDSSAMVITSLSWVSESPTVGVPGELLFRLTTGHVTLLRPKRG
jgi:hypothetical protein